MVHCSLYNYVLCAKIVTDTSIITAGLPPFILGKIIGLSLGLILGITIKRLQYLEQEEFVALGIYAVISMPAFAMGLVDPRFLAILYASTIALFLYIARFKDEDDWFHFYNT